MSPPIVPTHTAAPPARADAARNRVKVLAAAERLFGQYGVEAVSMDAIAQAAGVGKGTLYRRFGDRAGLALALLEEREREFQSAILRGPPPLGPGAPPLERLLAFADGVLDMLRAHGDLIMCSETTQAGARFKSGVYAAYRMHVTILLRQARPDADAELLADALLATLAADLHRYLRLVREMDDARVRAGVAEVVRGLATPPADPA